MSPRAVAVLAELATRPLTPEQVGVRTGMAKWYYASKVLKRLKRQKLVACLNPDDKIGRVYCIAPLKKRTVTRILRKAGIMRRMVALPSLNWTAYGRLQCGYCTQITAVFAMAERLMKEGKTVTMASLRARLPGMATNDVLRTLRKLVRCGLLRKQHTIPRTYVITKAGRAILAFDAGMDSESRLDSLKKSGVATSEWDRRPTGETPVQSQKAIQRSHY